MQKLKQKLSLILMGLVLINPTLVFAQTTTNTAAKANPYEYQGVQSSIEDYLCTPSATADGKDLERCINKLYRFGIGFGAIALVFFLVYAGYMYITSGESGKGAAKSTLQNALIGMGLLLGSYVLLGFINPNLLLFKTIQPPIFKAAPLPTCAELGLDKNCIVAGDGSNGTPGSNGNGNIVQIASAEVGNHGTGGSALHIEHLFLKEAFAANNAGPMINKYFVPGGTQGQPWCAYFATWVYGQAGINTLATMSGRGSTLGLVAYFKNNNGKKIAEGTLKYIPASAVLDGSANVLPGDLALYDRGTTTDPNGHTAIAVGYDPASKTLASIDGNQDESDSVKRKNRNILKECDGSSTCKLIGIGRVER